MRGVSGPAPPRALCVASTDLRPASRVEVGGGSRSEIGDLVSRPVGLGVAAAVSMLTAEGRMRHAQFFRSFAALLA